MTARPLSERTRDTCDIHAAGFDRHRSRAFFERGWIDRALAHVPAGGAVLDLGCGAGEPVVRYLIARGFAVTAVDFAPAMLALCRARFPGGDWRAANMRRLSLPRPFDAIIGWELFFHLTRAEQRDALPRIAGHLAPGGRLLLTVGPAAGAARGSVAGQPVFHASLSPQDYAGVLRTAGAPVEAFVPEDPDCDFHTLLLARRPP